MTCSTLFTPCLRPQGIPQVVNCPSRVLRPQRHLHSSRRIKSSRASICDVGTQIDNASINIPCNVRTSITTPFEIIDKSSHSRRSVSSGHPSSLHPVLTLSQRCRQNSGTTSPSPSNRKYDCASNLLNSVSHEIADIRLHFCRHRLISPRLARSFEVQKDREAYLSATQPHRGYHQSSRVPSSLTSSGCFRDLRQELWIQARFAKQSKSRAVQFLAYSSIAGTQPCLKIGGRGSKDSDRSRDIRWIKKYHGTEGLMSSAKVSDGEIETSAPAQHKPLVVGLKKPQTQTKPTAMDSADQSSAAAALNEEIKQNVQTNTSAAAPAEEQKTKKKEKAPKQPKPPKAAAPAAPISPALIDLRVGHILRAIAHPNADSLYVSTIAMGDPEGTEHTQVDEETGKVVRTVCSGLKAYIPLEEMQNRKIIVVANLKPVNMRSIKSAAMVLAASPKPEEGADAHAPDRVVELVVPPEGSEAGDKVYFEGWPYGEGKGPEKQLNPKKKQWESIQPGFYTTDDLTVGFDASLTEDVEGSNKGELVVEGKGKCTVPTLKGAVVR